MTRATTSKTHRSWQPSGAWITTRKVVQYLALLVFLVLFVLARRGDTAGDIVNIPMRLDPLLALSHLLSSRVFLMGSSLALLTVLLTLIFGRAWCGWLCPLGTVLDLFSLNRWRKIDAATPPDGWRGVKYFLLMVILVAALLGNLTLLVLDPLTLFYRTLAASIWPALDQIITASEVALYRIPFLAAPVSALDMWLRPEIFPSEPVYYRNALVFAIIFLGIIALNLIAPRFWCRYLCPLGGLLGIISKAALIRREVGEGCKGCTLCTQVCPTGTIDPQKNYASDPSECTMCLDCLEACPRSGIVFKARVSPAAWNEYDPGRRQALTSLGLAVAGVALVRSTPHTFREPSYLLRPPGTRENDFLEKCIRCGECVAACPTAALQPAVFEAGLEGLWTPVLVPRLGYCDYSCSACGQVCPVEAIPALALEEKRIQVVGTAYINTNRCIAWSDHQDCIVCEEMCPVPDKAIYLEEATVILRGGETKRIQLPYVNRELCIGCGICEYKCPINGEAAIRVYVPGDNVLSF